MRESARTTPVPLSASGRRGASGILALSSALILLEGCKVGPDYQAPELTTPDAWRLELTRGLSSGEADLRTWWKALNDPVLDGLIERASQKNLDLLVALSRIEEARALRGIARGALAPRIEGAGESLLYRDSEETPVGQLTRGEHEQLHTYGFDATWEIDVVGGLRRELEAADAGIEARVEEYRDLLVVLFAEVARSYVEVRTLQERLRLALANVAAQRSTLQLTQDRFRAQLIPQLDVRQAELNLSNTESLIPTLRSLLRQAIHRVGVLLGEYPGALVDDLSPPQPLPPAPEAVALGLPADLLRRRPDVRRAERTLAAQTALIGAATADLYPRFFLNGTLSLQASDLGALFPASSSYTYGFGPSFRWNLFAGGQVRNAIRAEDSRAQQALYAYEGTVLEAVEDVEDGLVAFVEERERRDALARSVAAARSSVDLVTTLYRNGLTDFQNVLDMQRSLFEQEDDLARSDGQVVQELIRIYKALGGGWAPEP